MQIERHHCLELGRERRDVDRRLYPKREADEPHPSAVDTVRAAIAKNSKSRNVPLSARVLAMFNGRNPARSGYVFQ